jgi:hypothetical protein
MSDDRGEPVLGLGSALEPRGKNTLDGCLGDLL